MYKKNELKNLIYIQENKSCNEQTVRGLFRSIIEPVLEKNTESLILCRLEEKSKKDFHSILQRLEYSNAKVYDFSDKSVSDKFENALKEKIWNKTEFIYVLAERFGAVLIFDYEEADMKNFAQIYILHNSKKLSDAFEIINANSKIDLSNYLEKMNPDRRDNEILNNSIRKIVENLNETNQEVLISRLEKETPQDEGDTTERLDFLLAKSSYVAHEMRNLLSICSLYSTIIEKQEDKIIVKDEEAKKSILNARECIRKSMKMTGNLLLDFKSLHGADLKEHNLQNLLESGLELAKIYAHGKDISFDSKKIEKVNVLVDENKFLSVIINLIKNAVESIEQSGEIKISTKTEDETVKVIISDNGKPVPEGIQQQIFEEGFTTKPTGSGLGLVICKKTLEEQFAQLKLKKSDEKSTEFEITVLKGEI